MTPKKIGKAFLSRLLEAQVKRLRKKHDFKVVAVAGSVGKTSTKFAIATLLGTQHKVLYQVGNYNDRLTVPLIFFGRDEPGIFNIPAWLKLLWNNQKSLGQDYPYEYVIVELGTDGPGQMKKFAYVQPDLLVLTAIAPEHMEYFKTLDAVAKEELAMMPYAKQLLVNADDTPAEYLENLTYKSYGIRHTADYMLGGMQAKKLAVTEVTLSVPDEPNLFAELHLLGMQGAKICLAAAATGHLLGYDAAAIREGLEAIRPVAGRMQILKGKNGTTIIDDTYNASPIAVKAALDVLYEADAPQRVAILGTMNELGEDSANAHREIGEYCDPSRLDLVVTIGQLAAENLAPAAEKRGCRVKCFTSPYEAGQYVLEHAKNNAVILAKGSQNGVFAEEAVKMLLANPDDAKELVRQTPYWMSVKQAQFGPPPELKPSEPNDRTARA